MLSFIIVTTKVPLINPLPRLHLLERVSLSTREESASSLELYVSFLLLSISQKLFSCQTSLYFINRWIGCVNWLIAILGHERHACWHGRCCDRGILRASYCEAAAPVRRLFLGSNEFLIILSLQCQSCRHLSPDGEHAWAQCHQTRRYVSHFLLPEYFCYKLSNIHLESMLWTESQSKSITLMLRAALFCRMQFIILLRSIILTPSSMSLHLLGEDLWVINSR